MTPNTHAPEMELEFPSSDGKPIAEDTRQFDAIATLKGNIEVIAPESAFVAADNLIYVDRRDPSARQAPDVYVAFGRPRGHRPCYKVWEENGVFPQVIFETLALSNTTDEMQRKRAFYFQHGADEYYEFDTETGLWAGFLRDATGAPVEVPQMDGHTSPRLGMVFGFRPAALWVFRPDGTRFLSFQEMEDDLRAHRDRADDAKRRADAARQRGDAARQRADDAQQRADEARQRADAARSEGEEYRRAADEACQRAEQPHQTADEVWRDIERMRALLRAAGIDPDSTP